MTARRPRVLVLTAFLDEPLVVEALRAGAKGYVLEDVDPDVLVRAIRAVRSGDSAVPAAAEAADAADAGRAAEPAVTYTARESQVVRLLARGLSNRQIGEALFISQTTVKFHLHNVMAKLGVRRRAEVVYRSGQLGLLPM